MSAGDPEYTKTSTGLMVLSRDFRDPRGAGARNQEIRPPVPRGQLWVDKTFGLEEAIEGLNVSRDQIPTSWKRPSEISKRPQLFVDGVSQYDIGQGGAGTCWFLSTASSIAEHPEQLKLVFPDDAYPVGRENYDGVFHSRFWRFGQWEDVYIDDFLPIIFDTLPWGAHSASDKNEFWVSLLEKAFARHHGNYKAVYGGQPGDAYLALTGGVAERIDFDNNQLQPEQVYSRICNAIGSGAFVTCAVPEKNHKVYGLVGAHAYTVTGMAKVKGTDLLRIRNPWGKREWKGPWSDGSAEWTGVSQDEVSRVVKDDGEFWISLKDFMKYFDQTTVCSLTPDFDLDGCTDSLNYVTYMYGEWRGETAAGPDLRLANPRFAFTVSQADAEDPLVVQLIQWREDRQTHNFGARCDVHKVLSDDGGTIAMELMPGQNISQYSRATQWTFRHKVTPGTYVVVPSTISPGQEKSFLIRVFSDCPLLNIRELPRECHMMSCEPQKSISYNGQDYALSHSQVMSGQWRAGYNAGGQIGRGESHATNPQFLITVSQPTLVAIQLMQEQVEPMMPLGLRLYPTRDAPMDIQTIYRLYDSASVDTSGKKYKFVMAWDTSTAYMLTPGHYTLVVHLNEVSTEKLFTLVIKSASPVNVTGYQTGM